MPPPSQPTHLPPSHPATRQRPKSPNRVLAEAEAQWLFSDAELANTPSIQDGMSQAEEQEVRAKGVNFIVQVGIMLKLPQLTLSTAAIFFQRFLMRASLKKERNGIPKLHQYQAAATALFLATKVEESCRKMKELILAFCRVAQKNPNLVIDEQSKDWWRWRDCILYNEDVLLETLCFDLTVESPHRQLFEMLKYYGVEHNKRLRNAAWSFVTDSNNTQLCLLCTSRTIAIAGLYAACRYCEIQLADDSKGRPWWEAQHVRLKDIRKAIEYMCASYDPASNKINGVSTGAAGSDGERSIYVGLSMDGAAEDDDSTRLKEDQTQDVQSPPYSQQQQQHQAAGAATASTSTGGAAPGSQRRLSNASSVGMKRERDDDTVSGTTLTDSQPPLNGVARDQKENKRPRLAEVEVEAEDPIPDPSGTLEMPPLDRNGSHDLKHREEVLRVENGNRESADVVAALPPSQPTKVREDATKTKIVDVDVEEGEVEE